jgi:hypothetical protein
MQSCSASLLFPPRLQQLHLFANNWPEDASGIAAALLTAIGQLQQLHTLQLHIPSESVSLAPLHQLPLLRALELHVPIPLRVEQFAADLRALRWLHRLHIHLPVILDQARLASIFIALLRDAPEEELRALQWRDFAVDGVRFTDELTPLLLRLSSLERLAVDLSFCTGFDFLSSFPRLTSLDLQLCWMTDDAWRNLYGVFLSDGLTRLHSLQLCGILCDNDDLCLLLKHTPLVRSLELDECPHCPPGVNCRSWRSS